MAKHVRTPGIRKSCNPLQTKAPKPMGGDTFNAMRSAFLDTQFGDAVRFSRMGQAIIKAVQQHQKRTQDEVKGWSTKLSFRTFKELQANGVLS